MKYLESVPSESALRRLVLAPVAAGLVAVVALVLAPPVADSVATVNLASAALEVIDDGEPLVVQGIDVEQTGASPTEPLSTSY